MKSLSYSELLAAMTAAYEARAGHSPDEASDIGIRLKVLADQLADYSEALAELERQSFPETATGECLERHAAARALARKPAAAARGTLRFSRASAGTGELVIPAGRICQPEGGEAMRFETLEDVTVPAPALFADCPARALEGGAGGNLAANTVTVMVTPAQGMTAVTNPLPFSGGADAEPDEALRGRLLASYGSLSNGANAAFYRDFALSFEGVSSAAVLPLRRGPGTVDVVVSGPGASPSPDVLEHLQAALEERREIGVSVLVLAAEEVALPLSVELAPRAGDSFEAVAALCRRALEEHFALLEVGRPLLLSALLGRLMQVQGVYNCHVLSPAADRYLLAHQIVRLGQVSISRMEVSA